MPNFTHLHVHTQYSLLDGASDISDLLKKVKNNGMKAIAITDHGNMFGVKKFVDYALKEGIKPIIGCEVYVAPKSRFEKDKDDKYNHLILLAKNPTGYKNLIRLVSLGFIEGFYSKPRIDKEILWQYSEGLIVSSACLGGEIPQMLMHKSVAEAEKVALEFKEHFGEDFYLEIMDHGIPEQKTVNKQLVTMARKLDIKFIATNDVHFINGDDAEAHDILICLNTGENFYTATADRKIKYSGQEFLKTPVEMAKIFADLPEALENTEEIYNKVETFKLDRPVILPQFALPDGFDTQDDYLRHLTFTGAEKRYLNMTAELEKQLDYELEVVRNMGFSGYFLIVQDFIAQARKMGVSVGPGRGSAAGSCVAYCTGITDIDPIKYNLLFERFLNPERVSMPDIDIDFDEDGRESVLNWVVDKYGKDHVAHIITFGTMAAKMSIKDVARVLELPLPEANKLAKFVPEKPGTTLKQAFEEVPELNDCKKNGDEKTKKTLAFAQTLEGSVRHTGIHACGVIIGPEALINHIPLCTNNETELLVTQFDGKHIENVGMLKMDFLGLKTLSIIKDAIENIKHSTGKLIDIDTIPYDDVKTFELYQRGDTVGTFQFESDGMRKYLRELKPTNIEDLIAMNALYRPGPMDFIPLFINRKHGLETVEYPHPSLEPILKDTYGIMVYQEQIMQAAQIMGGFTLGSADILRRAMGKKNANEMAKQRVNFVAGAAKKGIDEAKANYVFDVMAKFAEYGFNRSHSAAYSVLAFQTAYLKANYTAEYMAAVLSRNLNDMTKLTNYMDDSRRMKIPVLGPDVNESLAKFTVNRKGAIRFGMVGIKGVGEAAVENIIREREERGAFSSIYEFVERVNISTINKRNIEALALSGAFDSFSDVKRHHFTATDKDGTFIDTLVRYGANFQGQNNSANNLFGGAKAMKTVRPELPAANEWSQIEKLNKEKELIGIYLSAHPLDDYKLEIKSLCNTLLAEFEDMKKMNGREIKIAGIVSEAEHKTAKNGNPFGSLTLEDYSGQFKITLFGKDYLNFKQFMTVGYLLMLTGKNGTRFNSTDLEFKVSNIELLSEVRATKAKTITIKVPIETICDSLLDEIQGIISINKGNCLLQFLVYEPKTKVWIQMFSRSQRVTINSQLIDFLDRNEVLEYKVY